MDFLNAATEAAKEGGAILKEGFLSQVLAEKKGKHDVVTSSDRKSEETILRILKKYYPGHSFVAEESGRIKTASEYCWYIDPLDGTSHFITGNPYFSVSVGLASGGEMIAAVVFNPVTSELYTAEKGKGAFLNGMQIHVNHIDRLEEAIIASAYSAEESKMNAAISLIERLALKSRRVMVNFSPALDLCNTARGRLEGLITRGTTPEDHAAGSLILSEAGGVVQNFGNDKWHINEEGIIASNGFLQNQIVAVARSYN